jgi:hypothetical protein
MDDNPCCRFFLQPSADTQRLYEALRAVCVDGCRQKEVAARYGFSADAFRQQVSRFRARCAAGQPPPFSPRRRVAARPTATGQPRPPQTLLSRIAVP